MRKASLRVEIILWLSFLMVIAYFDRVSGGVSLSKGSVAQTCLSIELLCQITREKLCQIIRKVTGPGYALSQSRH